MNIYSEDDHSLVLRVVDEEKYTIELEYKNNVQGKSFKVEMNPLEATALYMHLYSLMGRLAEKAMSATMVDKK